MDKDDVTNGEMAKGCMPANSDCQEPLHVNSEINKIRQKPINVGSKPYVQITPQDVEMTVDPKMGLRDLEFKVAV